MNEPGAARAAVDPIAYAALQPVTVDPEVDAAVLPRDHPAWQRDVISLSARARAVIAGLKPLVIRVFGFWDHHLRELRIGGRTLGIESSGCYRLH